MRYDKDIISNIYDNNPNVLQVDAEIDDVDLSCIDLKEWKSWNIDMTMKWIRSLDNGHFVKYLDVLRSGFTSAGITAADLPLIGESDLRIQPFEITQFVDRNRLAQHFKSLNQDQGVIMSDTNNN